MLHLRQQVRFTIYCFDSKLFHIPYCLLYCLTSTSASKSVSASAPNSRTRNRMSACNKSMMNLGEMDLIDEEEKLKKGTCDTDNATGRKQGSLLKSDIEFLHSIKETIKLSPGDSRGVVFILDEESGYSLCELH